MKRLCLFLIAALAFSCEQKPVQTDFTEQLLEVIIAARNGKTVELPDLYDKAFEIPDPKTDRLILTEKLQARGFKLIETKNAVQGLTGTRSISQTLSKEGCNCQITKTYNRTEYVKEYNVSEKIKCE